MRFPAEEHDLEGSRVIKDGYDGHGIGIGIGIDDKDTRSGIDALCASSRRVTQPAYGRRSRSARWANCQLTRLAADGTGNVSAFRGHLFKRQLSTGQPAWGAFFGPFWAKILARAPFTPYFKAFLGLCQQGFSADVAPYPTAKSSGPERRFQHPEGRGFLHGAVQRRSAPFCPSHMPCRPIHCQPT